jgi:hypothetical protein
VGQDRRVTSTRLRRSHGWRDRVRAVPGGRLVLQAVVFVAGLLFVLLGLVLAALPGPLTIPPVLLGVWIWSTEFHWAQRLLSRVRVRADQAWRHARRRPVLSAAVTGGGLVVLGAVLYAASRFELVDRARSAVGL